MYPPWDTPCTSVDRGEPGVKKEKEECVDLEDNNQDEVFNSRRTVFLKQVFVSLVKTIMSYVHHPASLSSSSLSIERVSCLDPHPPAIDRVLHPPLHTQTPPPPPSSPSLSSPSPPLPRSLQEKQ